MLSFSNFKRNSQEFELIQKRCESSNYYERLGLSADALADEIEHAFTGIKNLISKMPETELTKATLTKAAEAHYILSDPEDRRAYDRQFIVGEKDFSSSNAPRDSAGRPILIDACDHDSTYALCEELLKSGDIKLACEKAKEGGLDQDQFDNLLKIRLQDLLESVLSKSDVDSYRAQAALGKFLDGLPEQPKQMLFSQAAFGLFKECCNNQALSKDEEKLNWLAKKLGMPELEGGKAFRDIYVILKSSLEMPSPGLVSMVAHTMWGKTNELGEKILLLRQPQIHALLLDVLGKMLDPYEDKSYDSAKACSGVRHFLCSGLVNDRDLAVVLAGITLKGKLAKNMLDSVRLDKCLDKMLCEELLRVHTFSSEPQFRMLDHGVVPMAILQYAQELAVKDGNMRNACIDLFAATLNKGDMAGAKSIAQHFRINRKLLKPSLVSYIDRLKETSNSNSAYEDAFKLAKELKASLPLRMHAGRFLSKFSAAA